MLRPDIPVTGLDGLVTLNLDVSTGTCGCAEVAATAAASLAAFFLAAAAPAPAAKTAPPALAASDPNHCPTLPRILMLCLGALATLNFEVLTGT